MPVQCNVQCTQPGLTTTHETSLVLITPTWVTLSRGFYHVTFTDREKEAYRIGRNAKVGLRLTVACCYKTNLHLSLLSMNTKLQLCCVELP